MLLLCRWSCEFRILSSSLCWCFLFRGCVGFLVVCPLCTVCIAVCRFEFLEVILDLLLAVFLFFYLVMLFLVMWGVFTLKKKCIQFYMYFIYTYNSLSAFYNVREQF
jgi:hypothetical protein